MVRTGLPLLVEVRSKLPSVNCEQFGVAVGVGVMGACGRGGGRCGGSVCIRVGLGVNVAVGVSVGVFVFVGLGVYGFRWGIV